MVTKHTTLIRAIIFGVLTTFSFTMYAATVTVSVTGEISDRTEVDYISFQVKSYSEVTIDMLAFETDFDYFGNGVGNDNLDSTIWVFAEPVSDATKIFQQAHNQIGGFDDGSQGDKDPYRKLFMDAGNYIAAIGSHYLDRISVLSGTNLRGETNGQYHLRITGDVALSSVPVPAAIWLMGSGLLALMGLSRKSKTQVAA